jgi:hypothetical protein
MRKTLLKKNSKRSFSKKYQVLGFYFKDILSKGFGEKNISSTFAFRFEKRRQMNFNYGKERKSHSSNFGMHRAQRVWRTRHVSLHHDEKSEEHDGSY